jgi:hypothetical protein
MNIVQILFTFLLIGFGCNSNSSQSNDFEKFVQRFETKVVPLTIDESVFANTYDDNNQIDSLTLEKYVEENRVIGNNSMYDFFRYYPLYVVSYESFIAAFILKRGGAGAYDDRVILRVFDHSGDPKSDLIVAKKLGDCSRLNLVELEMGQEELTMFKTLKKIDCDTEEVISSEESTIKYSIKPDGELVKL